MKKVLSLIFLFSLIHIDAVFALDGRSSNRHFNPLTVIAFACAGALFSWLLGLTVSLITNKKKAKRIITYVFIIIGTLGAAIFGFYLEALRSVSF